MDIQAVVAQPCRNGHKSSGVPDPEPHPDPHPDLAFLWTRAILERKQQSAVSRLTSDQESLTLLPQCVVQLPAQ